jgi:hypothetical protein
MRFIDTADVMHELIHAVLHNTTNIKRNSINHSKSNVKGGEARSAETSKISALCPRKVLQTVLPMSPAHNTILDANDEEHSN